MIRARPKLTTYFSEATVGGALLVRLDLECKRPTPFQGIDVQLSGAERRVIGYTTTGNVPTQITSDRSIINTRARFPAGILPAGHSRRQLEFVLPADASPSYRSSLTRIHYTLSVHVRIPWGLDRRASYPLQVRPAPSAAPPPAPGGFTSNQSDRADVPFVELSLADDVVSPGGILVGALAVGGGGTSGLRRLEVAILSEERARVRSHIAREDVQNLRSVIHEGPLDDGVAVPFRIRLPVELLPAMQTPFMELHHRLQVTAVRTLRDDLRLVVPLRWSSEVTQRAGEGGPELGNQRLLQVWQKAAAALRDAVFGAGEPSAWRGGIGAIEAAGNTLRFDVSGIGVVVQEIDGSLEATLAYDALGLELEVGERTFLRGGAPDWLDAATQGRLRLRAREPAQLHAVFTDALIRALLAFETLQMNDTSIRVREKGGVYLLKGLLGFVQRTWDLTVALAAAREKIPPPSALAKALPAYREFALASRCRLRVGDLSLHGWSASSQQFSLEHRFVEQEPIDSCVWLNATEASASRVAEEIARDSGQQPLVEERRVGLGIPLVLDPAAARRTAEQMAESASRVDRIRSGPYR